MSHYCLLFMRGSSIRGTDRLRLSASTWALLDFRYSKRKLLMLHNNAGAEEGQGGQAEVGVLVAEQGPALWVRQLARNKQGVRTGLQQHGAEAVAGATGALAGSQARVQKGQTLKPPPAGVGAGAVAAGGDVVAGRTGTLRERCPRGLQKQQQVRMMQQEVVMRKWGTRSPGQTFYPPMPSQMLLGR